jgi:hypothetical protein
MSKRALAIAAGGLVSLSLIKGIATAASMTVEDMRNLDPTTKNDFYTEAYFKQYPGITMSKVAIVGLDSVKTFLIGAAMTAPGGLLAAYLAS